MVIWNPDPEMMRIGGLSLRWYGTLAAMGLFVGYHLYCYFWQKEGRPRREVDYTLVILVLSVIMGARLAHCLIYDPHYYLSRPFEMLKIWQGGMASHGGFLGLFLGVFLVIRCVQNISVLQLLDRVIIPTGMVAALVRVGNLFNSEILGRPTQVPWAFVFVQVDQIPRHPTQLYEALAYALTVLVLMAMYLKPRFRDQPGMIIGVASLISTTLRLGIEFLKEPQAHYEEQWFLSVGQLLTIPFFVFGLMMVSGLPRRWPAIIAGRLEPEETGRIQEKNANIG